MMGRALNSAAWLLALTINAPALAADGAHSGVRMEAPPGFETLTAPRVVLVDVYFGQRKVGEALAEVASGRLRFRDPRAVIEKIPGVLDEPALSELLAGELPTNTQLVCAQSNRAQCGVMEPEHAGIIYDEDRFRVDLFLNPRFLAVRHEAGTGYLPAPDEGFSFTNALGLAASGALGGHTSYNLQNRTIVGAGRLRVRANTSVSSGLGFIVDDLVGEVEHEDRRYSAGLFWVPGNEFIGQRRVLGAGFGTQFDTALDRETLVGTPLIVFLPRPGRVELLVDGRLAGSGTYPAGSSQLDTSALPTGSYSLVLRIHEPGGSVREERRFFVKNAAIAPIGRPIVYGYAGMLARTRRNAPVSLSSDVYYQTGVAWRLSNALAVDAALLGTGRKAIAEVGGWLLKGPARVRAAALLSSAGDRGGLLQLVSAGQGPVTASVDVRRVWSRTGQPLIPLPSLVDSFDGARPAGLQLAGGSYTQATGSLGIRLGEAFVSVVGSYRKDRTLPADYSIGPALNWPILVHGRLQVVLEGSAQRTRVTSAGFVGARLLYSAGSLSMLSTAGGRFERRHGEGGRGRSRAVNSISAHYSRQSEDLRLNLEAGVDRDLASTAVRAGSSIDSTFGNGRADLLHDFEGRGGTQYGVSFQSGLALGGGTLSWGGLDLQQSAITVAVSGDAPEADFDLIVDEIPRGRVRGGKRLSLFLAPYRTYKVRLAPAVATAVSYDTAVREVTLYPGNVAALEWRADKTFVLFGQAFTAAGRPVASALAETGTGIGETDEAGYFQVETRRGDDVRMTLTDGGTCRIAVGQVPVKDDYASVGKVTCR